MPQWFSKLKQAFLPLKQQEQTETNELVDTVALDRKTLSEKPGATKPVEPTSSLSPFGSRILEKAKSESLKSDEERKKMTSPSELFLTSAQAKERVGHITSIALERSKKAMNSLTDAAKAMPDTSFKPLNKKTETEQK